MAADNLTIAQHNWSRRQTDFIKAGGDPQMIQSLMNQDVQRVLQGATPWNDTQAYQQMSAILGQPLVPAQQQSSGVRNLFGNFVGDIGSMVAGVGKLGIEAAIPSEWGNLGKQLGTAFINPLHHIGDPKYSYGFPEVPGLTTLGELATGKGSQLLKHPLNTLLDVAPVAGLASEGLAAATGMAGKVSDVEAAAEAAQGLTSTGRRTVMTEQYLASMDPVTLKQYNWMKALAEGHPLKALMVNSDALQNIKDALGVMDPNMKDALYRRISTTTRTKTEELSAVTSEIKTLQKKFVDDPAAMNIANRYMAQMTTSGDVISGIGDVSDAEIQQLADKAGVPVKELKSKFLKVRDTAEQIRQSYGHDKNLVPFDIAMPDGTTRTLHLRRSDKLMKAYDAQIKATEDLRAHQSIHGTLSDMIKGAKGTKAGKALFDEQMTSGRLTLKAAEATKAFQEAAAKEVPVEFMPALEQHIKRSIEGGKAKLTNIDVTSPTFVEQLSKTNSIASVKKVLSASGGAKAGADFQRFVSDTIAGWQQLAKQGFDPVWFGQAPADSVYDINRVKINFNTASPKTILERSMDIAPSIHDNFMGVSRMAKLALEYNTQTEIAGDIRKTFGVSEDTAKEMIRKEISARRKAPVGKALDDLMVKEYNDRFGSTEIPGMEGFMVPKPMADAISKMQKSFGGKLPSFLKKDIQRETGLYRTAVMFSPRHLAHVAFGGLMMLSLDEPSALFRIIQANNLYHDVKGVLPEIFSGQGVLEPNHLASFSTGKTLGRLWGHLPHLVEPIRQFEDHIANVQKAAVALSIAHGDLQALKLTDGAINHVREAALDQVYKTFVNLDDATPLERTILKNVFPFYGFTKHILKFTLQYPIDHPYRAEILNKLSEQELADQQSGLPLTFQRILWIGQPDSSGAKLGVDLRSWNPFRSLSGDWTLAGFMSNLNPAISLPFEWMGINKLSGTPELYPQLSVDPNSGALVAKRSTDTLGTIADIIPEGQVVDHFLQFSSGMRQTAKTNPEGYRAQLWSALGISFMPQKYDIPLDQAKLARHNLLVAQQAVSNFLNSGNTGDLQGWTRLPYQGTYVTPQQLTQLYNEVSGSLNLAGLGTTSIKAIIPQKRRRGHISFASLMAGL